MLATVSQNVRITRELSIYCTPVSGSQQFSYTAKFPRNLYKNVKTNITTDAMGRLPTLGKTVLVKGG